MPLTIRRTAGGDSEFPVQKQDGYLHARCLGWNFGSGFHRLDIKLNSKRKAQYSSLSSSNSLTNTHSLSLAGHALMTPVILVIRYLSKEMSWEFSGKIVHNWFLEYYFKYETITVFTLLKSSSAFIFNLMCLLNTSMMIEEGVV